MTHSKVPHSRRGPAFHRALGLIVHAENWPEYNTLYHVAQGRVHA